MSDYEIDDAYYQDEDEYYGDDYFEETEFVDSFARQQQAEMAEDIDRGLRTVIEGGKMGDIQMRMAQRVKTPLEIFEESLSIEFNKLKTKLNLDTYDKNTLFRISKFLEFPTMKNPAAYILGYYQYKNKNKKLVSYVDVEPVDVVKYTRFWQSLKL